MDLSHRSENKSRTTEIPIGEPTPESQTEEAQENPSALGVESAAGEALAVLQAKASENWERFLRVKAELDNFRKRVRERLEAARYANVALVEKLIPLLDSFDKALEAAEGSDSTSVESLRTGMSMVYNQFKATLEAAGVEAIDATDQAFDHNLHEAVSTRESSEVPEGMSFNNSAKATSSTIDSSALRQSSWLNLPAPSLLPWPNATTTRCWGWRRTPRPPRSRRPTESSR